MSSPDDDTMLPSEPTALKPDSLRSYHTRLGLCLTLVDHAHASAAQLRKDAIVAHYATNDARKPSLTPILGCACS